MKASISIRKPTTLGDANRDDLFVVHMAEFEGVVFCRSHTIVFPDPVLPTCEIVALASACQGDDARIRPGTMICVNESVQITFLTQVEPAKFRERDPAMTSDLRAALEKRLADLRSEFSPM